MKISSATRMTELFFYIIKVPTPKSNPPYPDSLWFPRIHALFTGGRLCCVVNTWRAGPMAAASRFRQGRIQQTGEWGLNSASFPHQGEEITWFSPLPSHELRLHVVRSTPNATSGLLSVLLNLGEENIISDHWTSIFSSLKQGVRPHDVRGDSYSICSSRSLVLGGVWAEAVCSLLHPQHIVHWRAHHSLGVRSGVMHWAPFWSGSLSLLWCNLMRWKIIIKIIICCHSAFFFLHFSCAALSFNWICI